MKQGGNNELILQNGSRAVKGVLVNVGNGLTRFIASRTSGDTLFIGLDTLIGAGSQNLQQVTDRGPNTTDTISVGGIRTVYIGPDSTSDAGYTIVVLPDLQYQTAFYPAEFTSIFNWIMDNRVNLNIRMVVGVGDMTQNNTTTEYDRLDSNYDRFDAVGLPYFVVPGNHDYAGAAVNSRDLTRYNDPAYFGIARNAAEYTAGTRRSWNGTTSETSWYKQTIGTKKWLFMGLQCFPTQAEVTWAKAQLDSFNTVEPERDVWITTHAYITAYGELSTDSSIAGPTTYGLTADYSGRELFDSLVRLYPNVKIVTGGHFIYATQGPAVQRITDVGKYGNTIQQFLINYQFDGGNYGYGYFSRFRFAPDSSKLTVSFYSHFLGQFDTRYPAYTLESGPLKIQNSVSISGGLVVGEATRIDSTLFLSKLPKGRIPYTKENGEIASASGLLYDNLTNAVTVPKITATDNIIGNDSLGIGTNPLVTAHVKGYTLLTQQTTAATGTYQPTLAGGFTPTLYVATGGTPGISGISLQRASTGSGGANFVFYKTGAADFTTPTAAAARVGSIVYQSPTTTGTIVQHGAFFNQIGSNGQNSISSAFAFEGRDTNSTTLVSHTILDFFRMQRVSGGVGLTGANPEFSMTTTSTFNTTGGAIRSVGLSIIKSSTRSAGSNDLTNSGLDISVSGAQVLHAATFSGGNVGIGTTVPATSAALDITSTTQGALVPRMTGAQQNAIGSPATALLIYNTDSLALCYYNGSAWRMVGGTNAGSTFIPTGTAGANVDAVTPFALHYTRSGSTVIFSGTVEIDATAAGGAIVELSLPFASAFTSTTDAAGTASTVNGAVYGSVANDRLVILITAAGGAPTQYQFTGSYQIK